MKDLQLTKTTDGKTAVQCSQLFRGLELDHANYTYWVNKNILKNPYAIEGVDYYPLSIKNYEIRNENLTNIEKSFVNAPIKTQRRTRNRTKGSDFILTLDFAKLLAMQTRSAKGHEIRLYFLQCEKNLKSIQTELFAELQAFRNLERIKAQRRELNKQAKQCRERIIQATETIKYIQLTLNFSDYGSN